MIEHWKNTTLTDIEGEEWKDVPDYEGLYQASSLGRIKSLRRKNSRGGTYKENTIILRQRAQKTGYLQIYISKDTAGLYISVHRLIAMTFYGKSSMQVNHIDFNKHNNFITNLEYVTARGNSQHAINGGRKKSFVGIGNVKNKLSEEQVMLMRKDYKTGLSLKEITLKYPVNKSSVQKIVTGGSWRHLPC